MRESASHTVDKGAKVFVRTGRDYSLMGVQRYFGGRRLRQDERWRELEPFKFKIIPVVARRGRLDFGNCGVG